MDSKERPEARTGAFILREGYPDKGGQNTATSQIRTRPAPPFVPSYGRKTAPSKGLRGRDKNT